MEVVVVGKEEGRGRHDTRAHTRNRPPLHQYTSDSFCTHHTRHSGVV